MPKVDYHELEKGSITRMIEGFYKRGQVVPAEIIESIDFNEVMSKGYTLPGENRYQSTKVEEPLGHNLVKNTDFECHKDLMQLSWLKPLEDRHSSNDEVLVRGLIRDKKFNTLERFLDLAREEKSKELLRLTERSLFGPILNIGGVASSWNEKYNKFSKKEKKLYYALFKKALEAYSDVYKSLTAISFPQGFNEDLTLWHKNRQYFASLFRDSMDNTMTGLIRDPDMLGPFMDAYAQYQGVPAQNNPLLNKKYFEEAFKSMNEELVSFYVGEFLTHKLYDQKQLDKMLQEFFNAEVASMVSTFSQSFNSNHQHIYANDPHLKSQYDLLKKYSTTSPAAADLMPLLLMEDTQFNETILKEIGKKTIRLNGLSLDEWKHVEQLLNHIKQEQGFTLRSSNKQEKQNHPEKLASFINENPYEFCYVINRINKLFPQHKPKSLAIDSPSMEKIATFFYDHIISHLKSMQDGNDLPNMRNMEERKSFIQSSLEHMCLSLHMPAKADMKPKAKL